MADKKITDLTLRSNVSDDVNFPVDDGVQTYRVTGPQLQTYINAVILNALVPTSTVLPFMGVTAPTGFLFCRGQRVSRTTYAALFTAIGSKCGSGDGTTTFNLPDMRNMFIRGASDWLTHDFATTDVNTSTDQITWTAGSVTRSGMKVQLTTTGTLPAGLALTTDYWTIYVSANAFQLATSEANALGGTAIDITDVGSGTHTVVSFGDPDVSARTAMTTGGSSTANLPGSVQDEDFLSHVHSTWYAPIESLPGGPVPFLLGTPDVDYNVNPAGGNETRPKNILMEHIIKT